MIELYLVGCALLLVGFMALLFYADLKQALVKLVEQQEKSQHPAQIAQPNLSNEPTLSDRPSSDRNL